MIRLLAIAAIAASLPLAALAAPCPGNPDALGTERVLAVDANSTPRLGRKQFPRTLPLQRKELVLTFDDGPWPGTTPKIRNALKHECVRATFFLLGRNVEAHPEIARRGARAPALEPRQQRAARLRAGRLRYDLAAHRNLPRDAAVLREDVRILALMAGQQTR